ncbi:peptide methionine sulfoxide reductase, partial [Sphaerosporella brunnea]
CFRVLHNHFWDEFDGKGLIDTRIGYCGCDMDYQGCTGIHGPSKSVQLLYDPEKIEYGQILEFIFCWHDPTYTTANRHGPDMGNSYRGAIFTHGPRQEEKAKETRDLVQKLCKSPMTTQIIPVGQWFDVEEYHQLYLNQS